MSFIHAERCLRRRIARTAHHARRNRNLKHSSRVARERHGLVETTLAQTRGMQGHRHEQARQWRRAFADGLRQQYSENSRVCIYPVVLELPDQIVGWGRESQRDHG